MIKFKSVSLRNFMSFGDKPTVFPLDTVGTTLITGVNKDTSGDNISANGAGKTASIQATLFALYNKGLDKLKADEFINITNGKRLEVVLEFEKNGHEYKISRRRKPSGVDLFIDGETHTLDSMANTDKLIQEIIGMPYEVFLTSFFLTPHNTSFMAMSGTEQRSLIESMLSLDTLVKRAESLKLIKKDLEVDLKLLDRDLQNAKSQNSSIMDNVSRLEKKRDEWDSSHEAKLEELQESLNECKAIDVDAIRDEWHLKQETSKKIDSISNEINELEKEKSSVEKDIIRIEMEVKEKNRTITEWKSALSNVDEWDRKNKEQIENLKLGLTDDIDDIDSQLESLTELFDEVDKKREASTRISQIESIVDGMIRAIEDLDGKIESLSSGVCYACNQSHFDKDEVKLLTDKRDSMLDEVESLAQEQEHLEEIMKGLTRKTSSQLREEISVLEKAKNNIKNTQEKIKTLMASENPYKSHIEAFESSGVELLVEEENASSLSSRLSELMTNLRGVETSIGSLKKEQKTLKSSVFSLCDEYGIESESQIDAMSSLCREVEQEIEEASSAINPFKEEVQMAKNSLVDISDIENQCEELQKDITHCNYLVKLLTDNKSFVRKNIVDKYIPLVNKKIVEYTELLGLLHVPSINSDLTTDIEYMNKSVSYYNLSQGERLRTNLSVSLAFRHLMKSLGNDTNLLIIDEYFDSGGDAVFLNKAFYLTQGQAPTVLMVSHREEYKEIVNHRLNIVKENGFSFIG